MDLEEHTNEELVEQRCETCGATLTTQEIRAAHETGGRFLCAVHATEELDPAEPDPLDGGAAA